MAHDVTAYRVTCSCGTCGAPIEQRPGRGRPRQFCGRDCYTRPARAPRLLTAAELQQRREYDQRRYAQQRGQWSDRSRAYYRANRDKINARAKAWYKAHRDLVLERRRVSTVHPGGRRGPVARPPRLCGCGATFQPWLTDQRFCSERCRSQQPTRRRYARAWTRSKRRAELRAAQS